MSTIRTLLLLLLLAASGLPAAASGDKADYTEVAARLRQVLATDSAGARAAADGMLRKDRRNPDLAAAIGTAFLQAGRLEDAEYFYDKGHHMKRITTNILNLAGDIAKARNDVDKAAYHYQRAIYFDKRDAQGYLKYARLYAKTDPQRAISQLSPLKLYRPAADVDRQIAAIYYDSNQFQQAADVYASLPADSLDKEAMTQYALSYYFRQRFDSALAVARQGAERFPRHPALVRMVLYNHTELQHYEEALQAAMRLFHNTDDAEYQYLDYIYYAYALNGVGLYDEAIAQFNKVIALNPDRLDALKAISDAYEHIGDHGRAISYYRQYLDKLPAEKKSAFEVYHLAQLYYAKGTDRQSDQEDDGRQTDQEDDDRQTARENDDRQTTAADALTTDQRQALREADRLYAQVEQMRPDSYLGAYWRARTCVALDPTSEQGLARSHYMRVVSMLTEQGQTGSPQLLECYKYLAYYYYLRHDTVSARLYTDKIIQADPTDAYARQLSTVLGS